MDKLPGRCVPDIVTSCSATQFLHPAGMCVDDCTIHTLIGRNGKCACETANDQGVSWIWVSWKDPTTRLKGWCQPPCPDSEPFRLRDNSCIIACPAP